MSTPGSFTSSFSSSSEGGVAYLELAPRLARNSGAGILSAVYVDDPLAHTPWGTGDGASAAGQSCGGDELKVLASTSQIVNMEVRYLYFRAFCWEPRMDWSGRFRGRFSRSMTPIDPTPSRSDQAALAGLHPLPSPQERSQRAAFR